MLSNFHSVQLLQEMVINASLPVHNEFAHFTLIVNNLSVSNKGLMNKFGRTVLFEDERFTKYTPRHLLGDKKYYH